MGFFVVDEKGAQKRLLGLVIMGKGAKSNALIPIGSHPIHAPNSPASN
jgi:hypothetical protein